MRICFKAVDDGLGALVGVVQGAEQACDLAAAGGGVDHVKAGVGAQQGVHLAVHAAQAVVVASSSTEARSCPTFW